MVWMLETRSLIEDLSIGIDQLIADGGIEAVSMRRMAGMVRMAPSSLSEHFGSKERILSKAAWRSSERRLARIEKCGYGDGIVGGEGAYAFVPRSEPDVRAERVWSVWRTSAHTHPEVERAMRLARESERSALARLLPRTTPRPAATPVEDLEELLAVLEGLTAARCRGTDPMPHWRATDLLQAWLSGKSAASAVTVPP